MKINFIILLLAYCLTSKTTHVQAQADIYYQPDTVVVDSFRYQGIPFNTSIEALEATLGKPDTMQVFGRGDVKTLEAIKQIKDPKFGLPPEALYRYGDTLSYRVKGTQAQLATVNFKHMSNHSQLKHPEFTLSKATTLKDIQQILPSSYASRNMGGEWWFGSS